MKKPEVISEAVVEDVMVAVVLATASTGHKEYMLTVSTGGSAWTLCSSPDADKVLRAFGWVKNKPARRLRKLKGVTCGEGA